MANSVNVDRLILEGYRRGHHWLPLRLGKKLGLLTPGRSQRWGKLGILPRRLVTNPYWLLLNVEFWAQRLAYIRGYYYEQAISQLLEDSLREGDIFVDIGAHIGIHTLHAAYLVGDSGQCFAVEPNPLNFARLQGHINVNRIHHVNLFHLALGRDSGTVVITGCGSENLGSSARPDKESDDACEVTMDTGDHLLQSIPENAQGLCKIDTEGFEFEVLFGMKDFIHSHPNFKYCVEVTDEWLRQCNASAEALFAFFRKFHFSSYAIGEGLTPLEAPKSTFQYDVLFVRDV